MIVKTLIILINTIFEFIFIALALMINIPRQITAIIRTQVFKKYDYTVSSKSRELVLDLTKLYHPPAGGQSQKEI